MGKKISSGKKKTQVEPASPSNFSPAQIKKFFDEVRVEFTKIVWPDRKVTFGLTGVVIFFSILASAYLGSVDLLLGKLIGMLLR